MSGWKKFISNPIKYTTDLIQEGLGHLNDMAEKIGLVPDPYSKNETYIPIARYDGSEYLETTAMKNENNGTIDNFIPNKANGRHGLTAPDCGRCCVPRRPPSNELYRDEKPLAGNGYPPSREYPY